MAKSKTPQRQNTNKRQSSKSEKLQRPQPFPRLPSRSDSGRRDTGQQPKPPKAESNNQSQNTSTDTSKETQS